MHCDTLWKLIDLDGQGDLMKNDCHISIPSMKKAGTVRFSLLLSWPPLRGGSRRSGWGRELYGDPKYFGLWQGSLPPPLRGTSLAEGGFSTRCASPTGEGFLIFASEASTPPYCCRACRCIRRAGSRQGPRRRGPRQEPGLRFQTRPRRTRRPWAGRGPRS